LKYNCLLDAKTTQLLRVERVLQNIQLREKIDCSKLQNYLATFALMQALFNVLMRLSRGTLKIKSGQINSMIGH